jgi:hypothetical protein
MKKLLLALFTFGTLFAFSQTATLTMPNDLAVANAGDQIVVPITIDAISQPDIGSFLISILYDPAALTIVQSQNLHPNANPAYYSENLAGIPGDYRGNWLDFLALSSFNVAPNDVLIELVFTVNADSYLDFATSKKVENNFAIKQATEMITGSFLPYALTLNNGYVMVGVTLDNTWTGAINNDWFEPLNWSMGTIPVGEDVVIPVTSKGNPVIFGGSATTGALTVMAGAGLAIDVNGDLTTNGLFTCDGDFELYTDAGGYSGSFVDKGGLAGVGMFYMNRIVTCAAGGDPYYAADPFGWHYISAPIDGYSTDDMLDFYVNQWDEVSNMWMNYAGTQPCVPYAPAEYLDGMEVWSVKYDQLWPYNGYFGGPCTQITNGPNIMYSGPFAALHTGAYGVLTTFSGGADAGWNLLPNPYPSGLVMDAIVWDAAAIPGGAFYDCPGGYVYWTPALGPYTSPVGNGFFTEYTAPGAFNLAGTERGTPSDWFYKDDITSLLIVEAAGPELSDKLYIRFMEEAQAGFAPDGDFHKLFSNGVGQPQIYTTAGADQMAINALPATESVPMGFTSATSGEYTISAIETSEFTEVYLQDVVTGAVTDLLAESYTFDYAVGDDAARFIIHFGALGTPEFDASSVKIWSNEHMINVIAPNINGEIVVVNMMGQEMARKDIDPGTNVIPMNEVNTYYIVKVITSENAVTGKVYIK